MNDDVVRLLEIQAIMLEFLDEADSIIASSVDKQVYNRAKAYWLAHVKTALTNEHEYVGGSMCSMQDTIDEMSSADDSPSEYACLGCGCEPGDGKTAGCVHPDGCGWSA